MKKLLSLVLLLSNFFYTAQTKTFLEDIKPTILYAASAGFCFLSMFGFKKAYDFDREASKCAKKIGAGPNNNTTNKGSNNYETQENKLLNSAQQKYRSLSENFFLGSIIALLPASYLLYKGKKNHNQ